MKNTSEPILLTELETSKYIRMSCSFLRKARMNGMRKGHTPGPPFIRIGRAIRFDVRDLDAWLEEHRCGGE